LHAGTGRPHSVRAMVETILQVSGAAVMPEFGAEPLRCGEPAVCAAAIERTVALTGWRPRHDLRSGVEQTWKWLLGRPLARAA